MAIPASRAWKRSSSALGFRDKVLKRIDQAVEGYHRSVPNSPEKSICLLDVYCLCLHWLETNPRPKRQAAVEDLCQHAMTEITSDPIIPAKLPEFVRIGKGSLLDPKEVRVNVIIVKQVADNGPFPAIDATIDTQIGDANNTAAFQAAKLTVVRANVNSFVAQTDPQPPNHSILLTNPPAPANMAGKLQNESSSSGARLIRYCNNLGGVAGLVDVAYVDHYDQDDVQGYTYHADVAHQSGPTPTRPIISITLNPPAAPGGHYPTTLAHELGHVLIGVRGHHDDPRNLMAGGMIRRATNSVTLGQLALLRNNDYVQ